MVETNKLASWLDDNTIEQEDCSMYIGGTSKNSDLFEKNFDSNNKLYPNYLSWCESNGVQPLAVQRFGNSLLDIAEHCKLKVSQGQRDSNGRKITGLRLRTKSDDHIQTPITQTIFSVDKCQSSDDTKHPAAPANAGRAGRAEHNLFEDIEDAEVF